MADLALPVPSNLHGPMFDVQVIEKKIVYEDTTNEREERNNEQTFY